MNSIVTRFAPSPSGYLHIGGLRTALINFIVTKKAKKEFPNSKFLLRIEDTDKKRSDDKYLNSIIDGLKWLEINHDNQIIIQSKRYKRHQEISNILLKKNKAFKCNCTSKILEEIRQENIKNKTGNKRFCTTCEGDSNVQSLTNNYSVRIKISPEKETKINDLVQGNVTVQNNELDNFIILRNDGSPTYMLSVVADDYDMGINLIIRGDDHLNNAFRQIHIYKNMDWKLPQYAHIPLIHGADGKKLSKRHGSVDINEFKNLGYLKESIINSLILLGWAPSNNTEIIQIEEIIDSFNIKKMSKSSSIFNYDKLNYLNNYYIKNEKNNQKFQNYLNQNNVLQKFQNNEKGQFERLYKIYKEKLNFYQELENICVPYYNNELIQKNSILDEEYNYIIKSFLIVIEKLKDWDINNLENIIKKFIQKQNIKFQKFGKPTRFILLNQENGPSISDILYILGKKNSIERIKSYIRSI